MKKNFVKKLALGLALVMAVTSVPVSSEAAAKPAFKSASVEVKEGETVKAVVKGTKGYTVKKVASKNDDVATVAKFAQKAKKTNVKVTGVKAGETTVVATLKKGDNKVKAKLAVTVVAEVAELKAVQTGSKQVTLTSSKDLTGATITVKKGNNTVASTATISGKEAVLTLGANIMADTYTVTVGEETTTFDGEASKVTTIEMGDIAVVDNGVQLPVQQSSVDAGAKATVAYRVLNQFGEDLTSVTTVNANGSLNVANVVPSKGLIQLDLILNMRDGDPVSVVIYDNTGVSASKTVKLSGASVVSGIEFEGIYNAAGKTLTEGTITGNTYYMLVSAVDQYGNPIKNAALLQNDIVVNAASITGLTFDTTTVKELTINGETKFGYAVKAGTIKAGDVTVLLIAKNTGKNTQAVFSVADGIKVDTFTVSPADMVVGGEDNVFEFTAIDTYGNVIEHPKTTMFSENVVFPTGFRFEKNATTGKTELIYTAASTAYDIPQVVSFITATNKPVTLTFTVKADAYPVAITGLKATTFTPGVLLNATNEVNASDIVFEDNYGRSMTAAAALKTINSKTYTVVPEYNNATDAVDYLTTTVTTATSSATTDVIKVVGSATAASITVPLTLKEAYTDNAGNAKVNVKSTYKVTMATKDINDLSDFKVYNTNTYAEISEGVINGHVGTSYATPIYVTGVASDGMVVDVDATHFAVYGALMGADDNIHGYNLYTATDAVAEKEAVVTVSIANAAGTSVKNTVKVLNQTPYAAKASVKLAYSTNKNTLPIAASGTVTNAELLDFVTVKDQYGNPYTPTVTRITVENVSEELIVANNGTTTAAVTTVGAKELLEVTYEYLSGVTFKTIIKLSK